MSALDAARKLSHSHRLRQKIALVTPDINITADALMNHPRLADVVPDYLFTLHCVVRASVPLMEAALEECDQRGSGDPVAVRLAPYLRSHIVEELGHDEWLLDDLAVVGVGRSEVLERPPSAAIAALVGSQYYWVHHYHPVVLLGYVAVLEGCPPTPQLVERLVSQTGYPRTAFRMLTDHAELDPHHRDELNEALDGLPLSPDQSALIGLNALQTVKLMGTAVRALLAADARPSR